MATIEMDRGARGWLYRTAQRHYWKVASWYDLDDLIQDGFLHYARLVQKYPDVEKPQHIMVLFKRTFLNHIHDLAKRVWRSPTETAALDLNFGQDVPQARSEDAVWDRLLVDEMDNATFEVALIHAPEPIRKVLELLMSVEGRRKLCALYRYRRGSLRESFNQRLARLTGLSPDIDFEKEFRSYLLPEEEKV